MQPTYFHSLLTLARKCIQLWSTVFQVGFLFPKVNANIRTGDFYVAVPTLQLDPLNVRSVENTKQFRHYINIYFIVLFIHLVFLACPCSY